MTVKAPLKSISNEPAPLALERDEHYWMGALAMTVAVAVDHPDPRAILRSSLREFLRDPVPTAELKGMLRTTLGGKP